MHCRRRLTVSDITDHVTCPLCSGYLIDATAVVGCMHLFCRSCLLRHIQANEKKCPKCGLRDVEFRRDLMVQRIVYKLVPHLLTRELRRRQKFAGNETNTQSAESRDLLPADMTSMIGLYADTDDISVCLQHLYSESAKQQLLTDELQRRYLLCPANTSIELVKKFVQSKFGLNSDKFQVELFHDGCLLDNCNSTLMDIAYSFNWDKSEPLTLDYVIVDCTFDEHMPPPPGVSVVSKSCGNRKRKMNESTRDGRRSDVRQQAKSEPIDVEKVENKNGSRNGGRNKLKTDGRNNKRQAENAADRSQQTKAASSSKFNTRLSAAVAGELSKSTSSPDLETPSNANCQVSLKSDHQGTSPICPATQAESGRSAAVDAVPTSAATSSLRSTGNSTEDDNCLSISTSVTVVISRRATAGSTSSTTEIGKDVVTVETGSSSGGCTTGSRMSDSSSSQQIVVNTKIPSVPGFAVTASTDISQRQSTGTRVVSASSSSSSSGPRNDETRTVDATLNVATSYDSGSPTSQTDDVIKFSNPIGSPASASSVDSAKRSITKRKSLESVIRSLKPIAVVSATSSNTDKAATSAAVAVPVSEPADVSSESSAAVDLSVKRKHVETATDDDGWQPQDLSAKCKRVVDCHGDSDRSISLSPPKAAPFPAGTNSSDQHPVKCGTRDRKATATAAKYYPGFGVPSFSFDRPPTREYDPRSIAATTAAVAAVTRDKYLATPVVVGNGFDSPMQLTRRLLRD